ncbi:thioredoxin family protein [Christiangramia fulva]|uniref:Thioredoxin family protein n=1 Tax=Christiangramia fulva TaxID=2126553 RepID=A0A2R3Z2A0_9FLAO|nr:thioredoxin family protein [Christiangramia fulva]AVR44369.1 thioredoxin family protein [Christiangramia fulva]
MKELLKKAVATAYNYQEYRGLVQHLADNNSTTGAPTEEKINFTKMNQQRMNRLDRTLNITGEEAKIFMNIPQKQIWLVILESWCGDGAQTIPLLNKIAEATDKIELKIIIRDENDEIIDQFLTNGTRSIPKLIILDEDLEVLDVWGPRSKEATRLVLEYKKRYGRIDGAFKAQLQLWYNKDKGQNIIRELIKIEDQLKDSSSALLT